MDVIAKHRRATGKISLLFELLFSDEIKLNLALCNEWNFLKLGLTTRRTAIMQRYFKELGPDGRTHPIGLT